MSVADDTILSVLVVSEDPASLDCPTDDVFRRPADTPPPVSDDRPFPFLRERTVPAFYVVSIVAMLVVSLIAVCGVGGPLRNMRPFADLFFMGVLVSVLLAVLLSKRGRFPDLRVLYALLLAAVVVAWIVPGHALLELSPVPRFVVAVAVPFAPIFLANLVFGLLAYTSHVRSSTSTATTSRGILTSPDRLAARGARIPG